ncbi:putative Tumor necrosis factor receptor superfamily member 1A protein, partial [Naja naja]
MIPLGFFQVLVIPVNLILIQWRIGESLAISLISESMRIHGVLAEKHTFVHSSGRGRREIQCQVGHYLHPNGTHCCIKCHKGTYLSEHCSGSDKAPNCSVCREGEYMPSQNSSPKCFACQPCRTSTGFQQITKSKCTKWENTVCGCYSNQYKTTRNAEFVCKNCSDCHNGKIRQDSAIRKIARNTELIFQNIVLGRIRHLIALCVAKVNTCLHKILHQSVLCQPCRTSTGFQQITKSKCTKWENTVCGCYSNQYKTTRNAEFVCKNCSDCHNGKIRQD